MFAIFWLKKYKKINLLKTKNLGMNKQQIKFVLKMLFQQLACQIGLVITSCFILKSNSLIFNQYAYFENVLDIFNGIFFCFASIVNIDICQSLGKQKFDETFKIGKFALLGTIVVWLIYFLLSLTFSKIILRGMSFEISQNNFLSMVLYALLHFLRFSCWIFNAYILCCGGETKILLIIEILNSIYFAILYLIANLLSCGIFGVYLVISIPSFLQIVIYYYIFKQKKWMKVLR